MSVVAVTIFVAAYVLIASDRVNKTMVALTGAAAVVVLPVITSHDIFYSHDTGIDWDVIFLLVGMMIIVGVLRQTGCSNTPRSGPPSAPAAPRYAS